jgi:nicotinate-nucleotide adenylyltransferase
VRIALFGGTFDPPHHGHLSIAAAAADTFGLDTVLFAPVGRQPLKPEGAMAPFEDRLAMLSLACADDPRLDISRLDAPHADGSPNYTVNTLRALQRAVPDARLFNLVGADSFLDLPQWHEPDRLLELAEWIVVSRPGFSLDDLSKLKLKPEQQARVHLLDTVHVDVASTELRQRLGSGDPCVDVLSPAVVRYIQEHHLYR